MNLLKAESVVRLRDLIVLRLSVSKKPPSLSDLRKPFDKWFLEPLGAARAPWAAEFQSLVDALRTEGQIDGRRNLLTEAGRQRCAELTAGVPLPRTLPWNGIVNRYLCAVALGITPQGEKEWKALASAEGLAPAIVANYFALDIGAAPTRSSACDALAWRMLQVGVPASPPRKAKFSAAAVIALLVPNSEKGTPLPRLSSYIVGAATQRAADVRDELICQWLGTRSRPERPELAGLRCRPTPPAATRANGDASGADVDLPSFAGTVRGIAKLLTHGRFGANKVFLNHVWDEFASAARALPLTRERFNALLVEANRQSLVTLSRADLGPAYGTEDVARSQIETRYGSFHFIRIDD